MTNSGEFRITKSSFWPGRGRGRGRGLMFKFFTDSYLAGSGRLAATASYYTQLVA